VVPESRRRAVSEPRRRGGAEPAERLDPLVLEFFEHREKRFKRNVSGVSIIIPTFVGTHSTTAPILEPFGKLRDHFSTEGRIEPRGHIPVSSKAIEWAYFFHFKEPINSMTSFETYWV